MIFKHKRWFDRLKFRHQLSLIFMGGIIVLTLVTSFVVSNVSTSIITEQQIKQSLQVTESLAGQSELALLYQSAESARDVAENAINFPGVKGITIETDSQEELFSLGRDFTELKVKRRVSVPSLVPGDVQPRLRQSTQYSPRRSRFLSVGLYHRAGGQRHTETHAAEYSK